MFNVCPGCGELRPEREVLSARGVVRCACGHEHPFTPGPLFIVGGASGTGKSTALLRMANSPLPVVALESDILWRDAFAEDHGDFVESWLRLAKNIGLNGKPVMLFGAGLVVPENVEGCVERRYFSEIHRVALVCEREVLEERLRARPEWRGSSRPTQLAAQLDYNDWIRANAAEHGIAVVDTTRISTDETARALVDWVTDRTRAREYWLRQATPEDIEFMFRIKRAAMRHHVEATYGPWDEADQRRRFDANFVPSADRIVVTPHGDVGTLSVEWDADPVFLAGIYLADYTRGSGLGTRIIQDVASAAHASNRPLALQVLLSNESARRLYERLGFRATGTSETHTYMQLAPD